MDEIPAFLLRHGLDSYGYLSDSEILKRLLAPLEEREREILLLRYGLDENSESLDLEQISERLNLTRERVRQIEARALSKMRHPRSDWPRQFEIYEKGYKFEPHADLYGADLHELDLQGKRMHGANLRNANLHGVNLTFADLRGADLRGADLVDAKLYKADLRGADLKGATLNTEEMKSRVQLYSELRESNHNLWVKIMDAYNRIWGNQIDETYLTGATMPDGSIHD
jgi:uncharacterized protein YjbI with pentapeptide repeats